MNPRLEWWGCAAAPPPPTQVQSFGGLPLHEPRMKSGAEDARTPHAIAIIVCSLDRTERVEMA